MSEFYTFSAVPLSGQGEISLSEYQGKFVLIVNTASACGLVPQLAGLEKLYQKYQSRIVILGFPCNQFGGQEPLDGEDISEFCMLKYGVSFPMFHKITVNGKDAHPLFTHLKEVLPGKLGSNVKWNFTKFLIGPDGAPLKRFGPTN